MFWRSPPDQPRWARPALLVVAAVSAVAYAWRAGSYLEGYYAAAVRSMSMSWHNLVFGAFDPAGTVTLDKLPGAFWFQALAVRLLGVHASAIVLPQIVEGVLSVLVLYRVVRRLRGPRAGILAAAVLAVSPATVALDRGNISDTLMVLLLLLAADAAVAALRDGGWWWVVLAGTWVGLAFQAKMIEAWIALPALVLVYAVAAAGSWRHRLLRCGTMVAAAVAVSLSWMTVVTLVPSASRPYVDGSQNDSLFQQVFVYNGFGRVDQETPNQLLSQSIGLPIPPPPPPSWDRLLTGALGRDGGWLLPAAVVSCVAGLLAGRRRPRGDPSRAHAILWGAWLAAMGLSFCVGSSLNTYYVAALSPPVAALVASGAQLAWHRRGSPWTRVVLAATVLVTVGYAVWLLPASGTGLPGWLEAAVLVVGVAAIGAVAAASRPGRSERLAAIALLGSLAAVLLVPAVASASVVADRLGPFDTPFQPRAVTVGIRNFFGVLGTTERLLPQVERARNGAPYLMATQTSVIAAPFIYDSGQEVLPIGGYTGTIPEPTLRAIEAMVHAGSFHLVIQSPTTDDPRLEWIAHHCLRLPPPSGTGVRTAAPLALHFCQPAS
jgi:4-amino-4-deoxy-L-arabinose transferase-like glycosyltransferase